MNILEKNYWGKHFPSDLRKQQCCAMKACLLSEICSVFGDYFEFSYNINNFTLIIGDSVCLIQN